MTGAPIYLVSACTSGEEFVAAFRRYADKNGLFVPISEPLPMGARARLAVTLKDGGVMIEGDAEVTSSARTPSALHGRIGMMVRFHTPDAPSKVLLDELIKARLAMKPSPPSVGPRPAEVPSEPRPVPPTPAGRIDAVNALAECVAIGDVAAAAPPTANGPSLPGLPPLGKSAPSAKFVVPAVPNLPTGARRPSTATGPGVPAVARRTTDDLKTEAIEPVLAGPPAGPSSDTYIAAVPPAPNASAIPHSHGALQSSPTDIGGLLVDPADAADLDSGGGDLAVPAAAARDEASTRTQVHAGAPKPPPRTRPVEDLSATVNTPPPDMPELRERLEQIARDQAAARARIVTPTQPSPPIVAAPRARTPEVEIAEPTDLSVGPPQPPALDLEESTAPDGVLRVPRRTVLGVAVVPTGEHVAPAGPGTGPRLPSVAKAVGQPAISPSGPMPAQPSAVLPIESVDDAGIDDPLVSIDPSAEALDAGAEPTGISPVEEVLLDNSLDLAADDPAVANTTDEQRAITDHLPTEPPDARIAKPAPVKTTPGAVPPSKLPTTRTPPAGSPAITKPGDWVMPSARLAGLVAASHELPSTTNTPPAGTPTTGAPGQPSRTKMPTGDWTIALDPQAPDGWSEPAAVKKPAPAVGGDHDAMSGQPAVVASAEPLDSAPKRASTHGEDRPAAEPKVQVDPTLIQPLRPMPSDGPLRPMPPDNPFAHLPSSVAEAPAFAPPVTVSAEMAAAEMPPELPLGMVMTPTPIVSMPPMAPMPSMPPMAPPVAYGAPQAPAYPMDPSYQMVPVESLARPRAPTVGGFASEPVMPPPPARRGRLIIVVVSAVVAAAIGAGVLFKLTHHDAPTGAPPEPPAKAVPKAASAVPEGAMPHAPSTTLAAPMPAAPAADPPAPAVTCFADVASLPAGAEIVVDQAVVGTTPTKLPLPCNAPVDITVRKAHLLAVTRTVTPTADGAPVKVALAKQTFLVKVSSMPAGATITMNGKQLGVTPTTIKIAAFEPSTLSLSKDGYATEAEQVTPKTNGIAVHTVLKRAR